MEKNILFKNRIFDAVGGTTDPTLSFYYFLLTASKYDYLGASTLKENVDRQKGYEAKIAKLKEYIYEDAATVSYIGKLQNLVDIVDSKSSDSKLYSFDANLAHHFSRLGSFEYQSKFDFMGELLEKSFSGEIISSKNFSACFSDFVGTVYPIVPKNFEDYNSVFYNSMNNSTIWFKYSNDVLQEPYNRYRDSLIHELMRLSTLEDRLQLIKFFQNSDSKATPENMREIVCLLENNPQMPLQWALSLTIGGENNDNSDKKS